jgi:hypothetical protein
MLTWKVGGKEGDQFWGTGTSTRQRSCMRGSDTLPNSKCAFCVY